MQTLYTGAVAPSADKSIIADGPITIGDGLMAMRVVLRAVWKGDKYEYVVHNQQFKAVGSRLVPLAEYDHGDYFGEDYGRAIQCYIRRMQDHLRRRLEVPVEQSPLPQEVSDALYGAHAVIRECHHDDGDFRSDVLERIEAALEVAGLEQPEVDEASDDDD